METTTSERAFFAQAAQLSTCLKRVVVCGLYDREGVLLSVGRNQCCPPDGKCARMTIGHASKTGEYSTDMCRSIHAEADALSRLPEGAKPHRALCYGHTFFCKPCEESLRNRGVEVLDIVAEGHGAGLRTQTGLSISKCDVCDKPGAFVACSQMGAISFAYCPECAQAGREPMGALVGGLMGCGQPAEWAPWVHPIVKATLAHYGKTLEELLVEVQVAEAEYAALDEPADPTELLKQRELPAQPLAGVRMERLEVAP